MTGPNSRPEKDGASAKAIPSDEPPREQITGLEIPPGASSKVLTASVFVVALGVVFYGLYTARAVVFPMVLAVLIALPLRPIMRRLSHLRIPRFVGATVVAITLLGAVGVALYFIAQPARAWLNDSPTKLQRVEAKLRALAGPLEEINEATKKVEEMTSEEPEAEAGPVPVQVAQPRLSSVMLTATGDFLVGTVITISLVFLLLIFGDDLIRAVIAVIPKRRDKRHLELVFMEMERAIGNYLLSYTIINVILGCVIGLGLYAIGLPNALMWGIMAAALNYIPFLGLMVGTCVVFLAAVLAFDSTAYALLAPAIYLLANGFEANVLTPALLGRAMRLNAVLIFVAIVIWGWMWGIGGALIAVPLLAVIKIICERSERLKPLAAVMGG